MVFDDILIQLGEFGKYQKITYLLATCLPGITVGYYAFISVFVLGVPKHRCVLPFLDNTTHHDSYEIQGPGHRDLISRYIPNFDPDDDQLMYDRCQYYSYENDSSSVNSTRKLVKCSEWVYSKDVFKSTFAEKIDLVCNNLYKVSLTRSLYSVGILIGAFLIGIMSDMVGRKKMLCLSIWLLIGSATGLAFAPSHPVFVALFMIKGFSSSGVFMTGYVIGMEMVGPSKRLFAGVVNEIFFVLGLVLMGGVAYALRDWFWIELTMIFPSLFFLSYWWIIPESSRWLINHGKVKEAEKIVRKAAKINKVTLPEKLFTDIDVKEAQTGRLWHLFTSRVLLIRTLIIFFNWMVVSLTYGGLLLYTENLGGNLYVNFLISAFVEVPAYVVCLLFLDRFGRKKIYCGAMLIGGIGCLCTIFSINFGGDGLESLTIALAMIGRFGSSTAIATIYMFSVELYPTTVRHAAMGASSFCGNLGGIIAPYVADSGTLIGGRIGKVVPLLIFGSVSIIAGLLSLKLPETRGKNLPDTIKDGERFEQSRENDISRRPGIDSTRL